MTEGIQGAVQFDAKELVIDRDREDDVLLAFCDNGSVATVFMESVLAALNHDMERANRGERRRVSATHHAAGPYIHDNRARIARFFLDYTNRQWLWFVDNDIDFPEDAAHQLLDVAEEHNIGILGGAYWNQYPGSARYLAWLAFMPSGIKAIPDLPVGDLPVPVTAVGMGMTLIHRQVLEDVAAMYPNDPWDTFASDMMVHLDDGRLLIGRTPEDFGEANLEGRIILENHRLGEDVTLCIRAQRAGYLTYGLPSLVVDHYKTHRMEHGRSDAVETAVSNGTKESVRALR